MFKGALSKDAFLSMMCQQSRSGRGVDTRWAMQTLNIARSTALILMAKMEKDGELVITKTVWRNNAVKFHYYPTDKIWDEYHSKTYRAGYLRYMRSMMEM